MTVENIKFGRILKCENCGCLEDTFSGKSYHFSICKKCVEKARKAEIIQGTCLLTPFGTHTHSREVHFLYETKHSALFDIGICDDCIADADKYFAELEKKKAEKPKPVRREPVQLEIQF